MLDIRFVRDNQEAVAEAMKNRHASGDAARSPSSTRLARAAIAKGRRRCRPSATPRRSRSAVMMAAGQKDEAEAASLARARHQRRAGRHRQDREAADEALREVLLRTPNMPADSHAGGRRRRRQPEVRRWGTPRDFAAEGFEMKPHWDLGPELGIIDFERAVKLAPAASSCWAAWAPV